MVVVVFWQWPLWAYPLAAAVWVGFIALVLLVVNRRAQ